MLELPFDERQGKLEKLFVDTEAIQAEDYYRAFVQTFRFTDQTSVNSATEHELIAWLGAVYGVP